MDVAVVSVIQIHGQYHNNEEAEKILYDTEFVSLQKGFCVIKGGGRKNFRKYKKQNRFEMCGDEEEGDDAEGENGEGRDEHLPTALFDMI